MYGGCRSSNLLIRTRLKMGKKKLTAEELILKEASKRATNKIISRYYNEYLDELEKSIRQQGGNNLINHSHKN